MSWLVAIISLVRVAVAADADALPAGYVAKSDNGLWIPDPISTKTRTVVDEGRSIRVPESMVYVPPGDLTPVTGGGHGGGGPPAGRDSPAVSSGRVTATHVGPFCIGLFHVTNAEYKAFLDSAGRGIRPPDYWVDREYPAEKANHPVVYISLSDATAYAEWVSRRTGWRVTIPTADQWERAARGPHNYQYPWGNSADVRVAGGVVTSRFNCNAVTAAKYLDREPDRVVTYENQRSPYFGRKTTVAKITAYDADGRGTPLAVKANGMVTGWVNHDTYTGFIYTDLFTAINRQGGETSAVGAYPGGVSGYGCFDMAGDVWDWCSTTIVSTNGAERGQRVNEIRGGSWYATAGSCRSTSIGEGRSGRSGYNTVGFRIVASPLE